MTYTNDKLAHLFRRTGLWISSLGNKFATPDADRELLSKLMGMVDCAKKLGKLSNHELAGVLCHKFGDYPCGSEEDAIVSEVVWRLDPEPRDEWIGPQRRYDRWANDQSQGSVSNAK